MRKIPRPIQCFLVTVLLLCIARAALAQDASPRPKPADLTGQTGEGKVSAVEFEYPGKLPKHVDQLVEVKAGGPLSLRLIRDSIKLLYMKGLFKNIVVIGRDTPEGTVVTFRLIPKLRITEVRFVGNDALSDGKLAARMTLKEDDFIEPRQLKASREALLKFYHDEGFPGAEVSLEPKEVSPLTAELIVNIREGRPTIISSVRITGELSLPEADLLKQAGKHNIEKGKRLRNEDLENAVNAISDYYVNKDYVTAQLERNVTISGNNAEVDFKVKAGPKLTADFEGNKKISRKKLKKVLTFWEDRDMSEDTVSENLDKLTDYYKMEGFYFVKITSRKEQAAAPPTVTVTFIINEGPRVALEHIIITGNKTLAKDRIEKAMELRESGLLFTERVTDEAVRQDAERIKNLYESEGFLKAGVTPQPIKFFDKDRKADVAFDIDEGPRTYVLSDTIVDGEGVPKKKVEAAIKQKVGEPFNPQLIKDDQNNILNLFSAAGYIRATVDTKREFVDDGRGVGLSYVIKQGGPVKIGKIILKGNVAAKDRVILRELLFKTGEPYDYEKILRSQQRIYRLGFFSQVRIQPVEPEKLEPVKDILITVKERDAGRLSFGAGYGDWDKLRGFAQVGYIDLFGLGHSISLRGDASFKETKVVATYKWPWFLGADLNYRTSLVYLNADKPNYHILDYIALTGFDKTFGKHVTSSLNYQYERIKFSNIAQGAVLNPEDLNKSNLASISPSVVFDYRDNPFNPTRGSMHAVIIKYADTYFGSTVNMLKATAQTSWYYPVYDHVIAAFSARGGIASSLQSKMDIPISERFFIGGASSLRGYSYESVAPLDKAGNPVGGDSMAIFNAELRFPLPYNFGLVTFLDAGNAWLLNKNVIVKAAPGETPAVTSSGTNGLRYGAGLGLRYETPVGPLRLDYGFKVNRRPGESIGELHFTLGEAF